MNRNIVSFCQDVVLFGSILAGLCFLCFFPSFEIANVQFTSLSAIPEDFSVAPGKLVIESLEKGTRHVQLNNSPVSLISENRFYFVAGIYGGLKKVLHGEIPEQQPFLAGILKSPRQTFFRNFINVETVPLSSGNTLRLPAHVRKKLQSADEEQKAFDRAQLITALKTDVKQNGRPCFKLPLDSKVTSHFGRPRTLPSGRSYYHSGVDLRAGTHTPIRVASAGRVVFAGHMLVPGNNVIVSHGEGLYSRYMHLETVSVNVGQKLNTHDLIGTAGATGRVEAPHLHWEVIWKGNHADPLRFVQDWAQICDPGSIE